MKANWADRRLGTAWIIQVFRALQQSKWSSGVQGTILGPSKWGGCREGPGYERQACETRWRCQHYLWASSPATKE